jgi:radical SAM superfamily enzyme YgiQ (UPF0313 family)
MIIGMDGDDDTVFERTYAFIMDNRISVPRVHIMTPIPGTPLHRRLAQEDRLIDVDFEQYTGGTVTFRPRHIDPVRLQTEYWNLYHRLFTWRAILHRVGRNRAGLGPYMRALVAGVNVHYRSHIHHRITPGIV